MIVDQLLSDESFNEIRQQAIYAISHLDTLDVGTEGRSDVERRLIYDRLAEVYRLSQLQPHMREDPELAIEGKKELTYCQVVLFLIIIAIIGTLIRAERSDVSVLGGGKSEVRKLDFTFMV